MANPSSSLFPIEKGIPLPERRPRREASRQYPWSSLEIGHSFFIPAPMTTLKLSSSLAYRHQNLGPRYVARTIDGGVRVWRVA